MLLVGFAVAEEACFFTTDVFFTGDIFTVCFFEVAIDVIGLTNDGVISNL